MSAICSFFETRQDGFFAKVCVKVLFFGVAIKSLDGIDSEASPSDTLPITADPAQEPTANDAHSDANNEDDDAAAIAGEDNVADSGAATIADEMNAADSGTAPCAVANTAVPSNNTIPTEIRSSDGRGAPPAIEAPSASNNIRSSIDAEDSFIVPHLKSWPSATEEVLPLPIPPSPKYLKVADNASSCIEEVTDTNSACSSSDDTLDLSQELCDLFGGDLFHYSFEEEKKNEEERGGIYKVMLC